MKNHMSSEALIGHTAQTVGIRFFKFGSNYLSHKGTKHHQSKLHLFNQQRDCQHNQPMIYEKELSFT